MLNDDNAPGFVRSEHGPVEDMAAEFHRLNEIVGDEHRRAMDGHVPPIVSMLCDSLTEQMNRMAVRSLLEGNGRGVQMAPTITLWLAIRIGYRLAEEEFTTEPCFCDCSQEMIDHYKKHLDELLEGY